MIDIAWIAAIVGALATIAAPVIALVRAIRKFTSRIDELEGWNTSQQTDINQLARENHIVLVGLLACLKGLQEQGCNGPVKQGIADIEEFMAETAHTPRSYNKKEK